MAKRIDNFPAPIVRILCERAGGICSRPTCNRLTMGPHTHPLKSKIVGVAAHICGASKGGPRYDPTQTNAQRKSIHNAIWLCEQCGREVDKDVSPYTKETLEEWKSTHERYISTLGSMGFREAFLTAPPTSTEAKIAMQMLSFFDDRRALYDLLSNETPNYVLRSIERIRDELWRWRAELPASSELANKLSFIRRACLEFLDDVGHLDSNLPIGPLGIGRWERLAAAMSAFRKVVGTHVGEIADKFEMPLSPELESIVPSGA